MGGKGLSTAQGTVQERSSVIQLQEGRHEREAAGLSGTGPAVGDWNPHSHVGGDVALLVVLLPTWLRLLVSFLYALRPPVVTASSFL